MAEEMVSINQVVDIVKELTRGGLTKFGGGVSPLADCNSRCGCVGQNCECYNQVRSSFDRLSWAEFQQAREMKLAELRTQLNAFEQDAVAMKQAIK